MALSSVSKVSYPQPNPAVNWTRRRTLSI